MNDAVKVQKRGAVLEVTLDRPKANAIDMRTSVAMGEAFVAFRDDADLRVAILTGGGEKFFCAGWDLKAAAEGEAYDADYGPGGFGGITELHDLDKPVIAAVNGLAFGGGFELALSCDMIVAAEHAEFCLPEIKVGVLADAATFRLPKRIPRNIALELLMTGRRMGAAEAARWGLANAVVPSAMEHAREVAEMLAKGPPLALAAIKAVVRETEMLSNEECYALMRSGNLSAFEAMLASEDAKEGPRAFAEKREPVWRGR